MQSLGHLSSFSESGSGVSGPSDSGSRSTSRDTGEGELRTVAIEVRVHCQLHTSRDGYISCNEPLCNLFLMSIFVFIPP